MKTHLPRFAILFLLLTMLLTTAGLVYAAIGDTERVSIATDGTQGNGNSNSLDVSEDGRYVVFTSGASTLVPNDTNGTADIFLRDRLTNTTTLVSVSSNGEQGNGLSSWPAISPNGRYVAFSSEATNLIPNDTNGRDDIFVHDLITGMTTRISVSSSGVEANNFSLFQDLSADGNMIVFISQATNLVPNDTNGYQDTFVHNRSTGVTTRVSVSSSGVQANHNSNYPSISADGRYVAFVSFADNLVAGDSNNSVDVFVHDLVTGETSIASLTNNGGLANGHSSPFSDVDLSADGRYVAFSSAATNLVPGDTNGVDDVFVRDRQEGTTTRVSVSSDGEQANAGGFWYIMPSISGDGRYVVFASKATNLVPGDTNGVQDVFAHDRLLGVTTRVSVSSSGGQGDKISGFYLSGAVPQISLDGRYIAFASEATNLVPGDTNGWWDIFIHDYLDPPGAPEPSEPPEPSCTPISNGGGVYMLDSGTVVIVPPGALPEEACCLWGDVYARPGADSSGAYPISFAIDIHVTDPDGNEITSFYHPLDICLPVTDEVIEIAGSVGNIRSGWRSSMGDGKPWTFLPTLVKTVGDHGQMACTSTSHFSVFTLLKNQAQSLPATGFAPGVVTDLEAPAVEYAPAVNGGMTLEIPRLGVRAPIVGVPETTAGWDVDWLDNNIGWLEGTAFPTWEGNTVLTGHVYDADGLPGVFANLNTLWWGDRIVVRSWGEEHVYAVRSVRLEWAHSRAPLRHDELDWLTLITCRGFDEDTGEYRWRTVVRAVRVE